ncbi:redoxin domain-containing protein [Chloroflexi bacterium TSY]|nr:redoxin domain-containing protein [Chloroflexi bacterium TSY]
MIPALREWHHKYADDGLTIIGVHTPEFNFEKDLGNVQQALLDLDVPYPVAIDNEMTTWRAYKNRYWPAMYFIDKQGNMRHLKIGEGRMAETEKVLQALLAEPL